MYTLAERLLMLLKWCRSFTTNHWRLDHYPVRVRINRVEDPKIRWMAQILNWAGPVGLGATPEAARAALGAELESIRGKRPSMPRPGSHVRLQFASSARLDADADLYEDFREHILQMEWVFMSDRSSLSDFGESEHVALLIRRISERYGVDVGGLGSLVVADIFDYIRANRTR